MVLRKVVSMEVSELSNIGDSESFAFTTEYEYPVTRHTSEPPLPSRGIHHFFSSEVESHYLLKTCDVETYREGGRETVFGVAHSVEEANERLYGRAMQAAENFEREISSEFLSDKFEGLSDKTKYSNQSLSCKNQ